MVGNVILPSYVQNWDSWFKHSIVLNGLALLDSTLVQFLCSESIND